jgi:DNA-binding LacI/PurR family transcriptional regulator
MPPTDFATIAEQVAAHLRGELLRGRWRGVLPGRDRLADELGVSRKTVQRALEKLEDRGVLAPQGVGRRRRIVLPEAPEASRPLRVAILVGEAAARRSDYMIELQHELVEAGHTAFHAARTLCELGMAVRRVARLVAGTTADAWVVSAGSREVLEWFAGREAPAFALFGRRRGLLLAGAGPDKPLAITRATRTLLELGHRRVVLLVRRARRLPQPGAAERAFLAELIDRGIACGPYHMPDWVETSDGFQACLESLFRLTPPTALIIDEAPFFFAVQQFCGRHGLRVPEDVSLVCTDASPGFAWCRPTIAHIRWDSRPVVRRIVRWAANVSHGRQDRRQSFTPAEFVPGGTIGPAPDPSRCRTIVAEPPGHQKGLVMEQRHPQQGQREENELDGKSCHQLNIDFPVQFALSPFDT